MSAVEFDGKAFAAGLSIAPGVYRMYAADGSLLYVGKAGALRRRVASYFNSSPKSPRTLAMLAQVAKMEVTATRTEAEALLLENQLIKSLTPRYNVLLRDDKSYPYVLLTREPWPRLTMHRGARTVSGRYFGPYPGVGAVHETLNLMHKLFKLRGCEDSVFNNRSRPCLQYQIDRCTAPCVGLISETDYAESVRHATLFLEGRSDDLSSGLVRSMEIASGRLEFEEAARLRDLIAALRSLQARQYVDGHALDLDALACAIRGNAACVLLWAFRDGRNLGTRTFFPKTNGEENVGEILGAFVSQYYAEHPIPSEILLSHVIPDVTLIEQALTESSGHKVTLKSTLRGTRAGYIDLARRNAEMALVTELNSRSAQRARSEALRELLRLDDIPSRIECFDISHTMGEAAVASCVVFDAEGAVRGQYRRYNITGIEPGDDYAAIRQAIERRFRRAVEARAAKEDAVAESVRDNARISRLEKESVLPDVLLIDGGAGQLAQAQAVLAELGVDGIALISVAKGEARRSGHETLIFPDGREISPGAASLALQFIQQVRDEAHRFAITGHRGQRQKARTTSRLEDIPGIGPRRRAALLKHFGGLAGLKAAGEEEIARVDGINAALAARIYASLHGLPSSSFTDKSQAPY